MTVFYLNLYYNERGCKVTVLYFSFNEDNTCSSYWHQLINLFDPYKPSILLWDICKQCRPCSGSSVFAYSSDILY